MGKLIQELEKQELENDQITRTEYDLSHWVMSCGDIGRLQTLSVIPVIAGDTLEIDLQSIFRLSPLRRNMYLDCMIDLFAFYVPHRHIYGSNWQSFILAGVDEGVTLGTRTITNGAACFGVNTSAGATMPKFYPEGYLQIWNRYFKRPSDSDLAMSYFDALSAGDNRLLYGLQCCYPKRVWNTGIVADVTTADYRVPLSDTNTTLDLLSFADYQGRLKTERIREWFGRRYTDLLKSSFGGGATVDADQRPILLYRQQEWLSGHDVDATDTTSLGSYSGKGVSSGGFTIPPRFFAEHGAVWIMCLLRFPALHSHEKHYLYSKSEPTYAQISGDPDVYNRQAPMTLDVRDYIGGGATLADGGIIPYGQWYREQPNNVHTTYNTITGHPWCNTAFSSKTETDYINTGWLESIFGSLQLRMWQAQGHVAVRALRVIPDVRTSIFAGTN